MNRTWKLSVIGGAVAIAAVAAGGAALTAQSPAPAAVANTAAASTAASDPQDAAYHSNTRLVGLRAMPAGTVGFGHDTQGALDATFTVTGLTPGSAHSVWLVRNGIPFAAFGNVTANGVGAVNATVSTIHSGDLPHGTELELLEGTAGLFGQHNALAATPIARTTALPGDPDRRMPLLAEDITAGGVHEGLLYGGAVITVHPAQHTVTVTVDATGFNPGAHAAHLHSGSCAAQGGVWLMLPDLTADAHGRIHTSVTASLPANATTVPATGIYLNIHQGDMNSILSNGSPTLSFRPLLCGNV